MNFSYSKKLTLLLLIAGVLFNSCKKMDGTYLNATGAADTYQPITANSYWKYRNGTDSTVNVMTANKATFKGKVYSQLTSNSNLYSGMQTGYFYPGTNHYYSERSTTLINGITIDIVYLNDAVPVGSTWVSNVTDDGTINSIPAHSVGTIVEKGIAKTVLGKTFTDVIHTKVDLQYDFGTGFTSTAIYEFYVAKNVGIIETDSKVMGINFNPSYLFDYSIK